MRGIATGVAVVLLLLIGTAGVIDASGSPKGEGSIARFREVEQSRTVLGHFAGATETWRTTVVLQRTTRAVGDGVVACIRIRHASSLRQCVGTYTLPEGAIQVAGTVLNRNRYVLYITGTSGVYATKHGTALFVQIASQPRQSLVTFYFE